MFMDTVRIVECQRESERASPLPFPSASSPRGIERARWQPRPGGRRPIHDENQLSPIYRDSVFPASHRWVSQNHRTGLGVWNGMTYRGSLESGEKIAVENDGEQTQIMVASDSSGQQQSQSTRFTTGVWTKPPTVLKVKGGAVLEVRSNRGEFHFQITGGAIRALREVPRLQHALPRKKSKADVEPAMRPLPPMKPMRPMEPMKPLAPMEPMSPMRPMEMTMGEMRMSMGKNVDDPPREKSAGKGATRFCTECGREAASKDKFCAACGHRLI